MDRRLNFGGAHRQNEDRCEQLRPSLSLYVDGVSTPEEQQAVELHIAGCAACRSVYEWMVATREVMTRRPAAIPPPEMSQRIRLALAATRAEEARQAYRFRTIYRPAYALAATAVIAALLYGALGHKQSGFGRHTPIQVANVPPHTDGVGSLPADNVAPQPITTVPSVRPTPHAGHRVTVAAHDDPKVEPGKEERHPRSHGGPANHDAENDTPTGASGATPLKLVVPAPKTISPRLTSPLHRPAPVIAIKPAPPRRIAPVVVDKPHHDDVVAQGDVPDTSSPGIVPSSPGGGSDAGSPPDTHPTMVASQPDTHSGSGLLADVRGYVAIMKTKAPSTGSYRVRHAPEIRSASFNTPTSDGNMGESISGTASIVASEYR